MKAIALIPAALAFGACATPFAASQPISGDGVASIGQSTRVGGLIVSPQALVDDSRCPINARCVWAGRLVLRTLIAGRGWRETVDLTLGQAYPTHGARLSLVSAEPGKMAGSPPSPPANRFAFEAR